jgi:tRNA U55 pseudouridine synthase TruB
MVKVGVLVFSFSMMGSYLTTKPMVVTTTTTTTTVRKILPLEKIFHVGSLALEIPLGKFISR